MRRLLILLTAFAVLAAACTSDSNDAATSSTSTPSTIDIGTPGFDIQLIAALSTFGSCDAFLDHVRSNALEAVGPWGLGGGFWDPRIAVDVMETMGDGDDSADFDAPSATIATESSASSDAGADDAAVGREGVDFSGTNVQEIGVDEPDLVKTDGSRMLVLAQNTLHLLDVTGEAPDLVATLDLPQGMWVQDMLFDGDRVLLLSSANQYEIMPMMDVRSSVLPTGSAISTLVEVDIDGANMTIDRKLHLDGAQLSARMIDGVVRVVLQSGPVGFEWAYPEYGGEGLRAEREAENAEEVATEKNRELIRNSTIENWLPYYVLEEADGTVLDEGVLVDCERAYHPEEFAGLNMLNVVTVDLRGGGLDAPDATAVLADGQIVYASTESLYVATTEWLNPIEFFASDGTLRDVEEPEITTSIHRFDITDPTRTDYLASGSVPGTILNQYSMSEHEGHLRVATTHDSMWGRTQEESSSSLYVLETAEGDSGAVLRVVGQVDDLGRGERIFAVRYLGDLATVVTFRQTDPLYTIDVSDPTAPRVLGELKINGYSAYLHPLSDDLLLGVGQDATDQGRTLGTQVSLFDIEDRENPTRIAQWALPNAYSDTEWDARAFLWWPAEDLVVIPVNTHSWNDETGEDESFFGAIGLKIGDGTITELGRVSQQEPTRKRECYGPDGWFIERVNDDGTTEVIEAYDHEGRPVDVRDGQIVEIPKPSPARDSQAPVAEETEPAPAEPAPPAEEAPPVIEPDEPPVDECWTFVDSDWRAQIRRTVVVGDQLHTISEKGVLTVDVASFEEIGAVEFPVRNF